MSQYFALFQIGPVQEFIQTARKTQDFWSGSFLLSYFCALAINSLDHEKTIFPDVTDNPLFQEVQKQDGAIPWNGNIAPSVYRPTIPNRLFCILDDTDISVNKLKKAKEIINNVWQKIAKKIFNELPTEPKNDSTWKTIWKKQVQDPFEILYVWLKKEDSEDYGIAYRKCETLMGSRKMSRWFNDVEPEKGHKCSLCGVRESLHFDIDKPYTRKDIREQWNAKVRVHNLIYEFRKGETLCSVCTIKRLAPRIIFRNTIGIPSTSTVAVGKTVKELLSMSTGGGIRTLLTNFEEAAKRAAGCCQEPREVAQMSFNNMLNPSFLKVDGDWYFREYYQNLRKKYNNDPNPLKIESIAYAEDSMKDLLKYKEEGVSCTSPTKYFAILTADGDDMGKLISDIENEEEHKDISRFLSLFSIKTAFEVFQDNHLGHVIYFGGDEGVSFVTLQDLFPVMEALYYEWEKKMVEFNISTPPTLSMGVAIAHHQDGLRGVIERAHQALDAAKDLKGKDAFCIRLARRSSGEVLCRSKWLLDGFPVIPVLKEFQTAYEGEKLSPSWITDLRAEIKSLGDPREDHTGIETWNDEASRLCSWETERLILRHSKPQVDNENLIHQAQALSEKLSFIPSPAGKVPNRNRFRDFINLMDLAYYVAKGGGR